MSVNVHETECRKKVKVKFKVPFLCNEMYISAKDIKVSNTRARGRRHNLDLRKSDRKK